MFFWLMIFVAVLPVKPDADVDFDHDVIPVLTKAGCNTGACHGAAIGRGGFKLSLYGSDPVADYQAIALELKGRRVNLLEPEQSLVLMKPTEAMEHGGGFRLDPESEAAARLGHWIRAGAKRNDLKLRTKFSRLDVSPSSVVIRDPDQRLKLKAVAHFSDGSVRDVTRETVFSPEDPAAVEIDSKTAEVRVLRNGRHVVIARYLSQVKPVEIILPFHGSSVSGDTDKQNSVLDQKQFIDRAVNDLLATLGVPLSGDAGDDVFLRRVTLNLTGRLPDAETMQAFLADDESKRRINLIDRLLKSDEFTEYWTLQLAKLLRIHAEPGNETGAQRYHQWLQRQIAGNVGYDVIAKTLLTAKGDTHQVAPANFYRTVGGPREQAEFTSELFMGTRLRCANCHDHPLDQWTQDDYHGLASVFAKIRSGQIVKVSDNGQVIHPKTGKVAIPRIPGAKFVDDSDEPLNVFADWLVADQNPYFARAIVNRLWKSMMGRGLVEPADDLRATNPATHPKLLKKLADDFVEHEFDLRHTLRLIAASHAYARSSHSISGNESDVRYYSHRIGQRMEPEVLADAISDVLGIPELYGEKPLGTRAVMLANPKIESVTLDALGRCAREDSCEKPVSLAGTGGLTLKLHLFNGPILNQRIAGSDGRLSRLLAAGKANEAIVEEFYRVALSRPVTDIEQQFWSRQLKEGNGERRNLLEDFVWSVLTCKEFVTNH
ncbi:MAG: DUF1549 domain-containing protein [Rubripirellula sp.]